MFKKCKAEKEMPKQYKEFHSCLDCPFHNNWDKYEDCYLTFEELVSAILSHI